MGRADELHTLSRVLDVAAAGRAATVLVVGEAGIGKTALAEAAVEQALRRGFLLLDVTGLPGESGVPGAALTLLAARLEASGVPGEVVEPLISASSAKTSVPALLHVLATASGIGPLLLLADDVHWWDQLSLRSLLFAARRLAVDPVAILALGRTTVLDDRGLAALPRLELGPVPRAMAGDLARCVAPDTTDDVARALWTAMDGNSLGVVETAARLSSAERSGRAPVPATPSVGPGVVERWAGHIDRLPESSRLALTVMAVVAGEETLVSALTSAGVSVDDLLPAEKDGLVVEDGLRWRFRHPLVRYAILATQPASAARAAHAAAAHALDDAGPGPQKVLRRALHRAAAAVGPDPVLAGELAADGELIEHLGAPTAAVRVLELSATADPDFTSAGARLAHAASLALDDFDDIEALRLGRLGLALDPPARIRGSLLRLTGVSLARVEDAHEGCLLLGESLDLLDGEERGQAVRDLLFSLDLSSDRRSQAPELLDALGPVDRLRAVDRLLVAHTRAHLEPGADTHGALLGAFEDVEEDDVLESGRAMETVFDAGIDVGLEVSAPLLRRLVDLLTESGDPRRRLEGIGIDSMLAFWEGRWTEQVDRLAETRELCDSLGRPDLYSHAIELTQLGRQGRAEDFRASLDRARSVMTAAGYDFWVDAFPGEQAMLALTLGHVDEATALLLPEADSLDVRISAHTAYADHLVTLVECLADAGRRDEAGESLARLRRLLGPSSSALGTGFLARAEAAVSSEDAGELFSTAEERIETGIHVFELAMTRLRHGRWLRRHRRRRDAAGVLVPALDTFEGLGCVQWAEHCRAELRAVGVDVGRTARYDARAQLTAQERRVADAVLSGAGNDEVARQLFMSPRTVETHLTHVYRKLGISGRAELAALCHARADGLRAVP